MKIGLSPGVRFVVLAFCLGSSVGCGAARIVRYPGADGGPLVAKAPAETETGEAGGSVPIAKEVVELESGVQEFAEAIAQAGADAAVDVVVAPEDEEVEAGVETEAEVDTDDALAEAVEVVDAPEGEQSGSVEVAIDAPIGSQVEYRMDGDDPVAADLSFDVGVVDEGEHELAVVVTLPDGKKEKRKFRWKQKRKYHPDEKVDADEDARRKKEKRERREKRKKRRAEREERKRKRQDEREERREDRRDDRAEKDAKQDKGDKKK